MHWHQAQDADASGCLVVRRTAMRKALLLMMVALAALVASQWPDIKRYVMITRLSQGQGHPEYVPAGGSTAYPHSPNGRAARRDPDFDAASRGGPES